MCGRFGVLLSDKFLLELDFLAFTGEGFSGASGSG
jgi:hypothetical protein